MSSQLIARKARTASLVKRELALDSAGSEPPETMVVRMLEPKKVIVRTKAREAFETFGCGIAIASVGIATVNMLTCSALVKGRHMRLLGVCNTAGDQCKERIIYF
jgi:hypothetical protein